MAVKDATINDLMPGLNDEKPDPPPAKIVDLAGEVEEEVPAAKTKKKAAKKAKTRAAAKTKKKKSKKAAKKKVAKKSSKKRAKASKVGNKVCVRCGEEKPAKEFPLVKKDDGPDGRRRSYCHPCWPKYQQEYRQRKENGEVKTKKKAKKKATRKAAKKTKKKVTRKTVKNKKKKMRKKSKRTASKMVNGHLGALIEELKDELINIRKEREALAKTEIGVERRLEKLQKLADAW